MTKLEIQAIKKLPPRFVRDGTAVATTRNLSGQKFVVAINPAWEPIQYQECHGKWERIKFIAAEIDRLQRVKK